MILTNHWLTLTKVPRPCDYGYDMITPSYDNLHTFKVIYISYCNLLLKFRCFDSDFWSLFFWPNVWHVTSTAQRTPHRVAVLLVAFYGCINKSDKSFMLGPFIAFHPAIQPHRQMGSQAAVTKATNAREANQGGSKGRTHSRGNESCQIFGVQCLNE